MMQSVAITEAVSRGMRSVSSPISANGARRAAMRGVSPARSPIRGGAGVADYTDDSLLSPVGSPGRSDAVLLRCRETIERLHSELEEERQHRRELHRQLLAMESDLQTARAELEREQGMRADSESRAVRLDRQSADCEAKLQTQKKQCEALNEQLQKAKVDAVQRAQELFSKGLKVSELEGAVRRCEAQVATAQGEHSRVEKESRETFERVTKLEAEVTQLQSALEVEVSKTQRANRLAEEQERRCQEVQREIDEIQANARVTEDTLRQQLAEARKQYERAAASWREREAERIAEVSDFQRRLADADAQASTHERRVEHLQTEIAASRSQLEASFRSAQEDHARDYSRAREEIAARSAELTTVRSEFEAAQQQAVHLQEKRFIQDRRSLEEERRALQEKWFGLCADSTKLHQQMEQYQLQLGDKQRELAERVEEVHKLEGRLAAAVTNCELQARAELNEAHDRAETEIHQAALELTEQRGRYSALEERHAEFVRNQQSSIAGYTEVHSRLEQHQSQLIEKQGQITKLGEEVRKAEAYRTAAVWKCEQQARAELSEARERAEAEIHQAVLELTEQRGRYSALEERHAEFVRNQQSSIAGYTEVHCQVEQYQSQLIDKQRQITELGEEVRKAEANRTAALWKYEQQARAELSEARDRAEAEIHQAALALTEQRGKHSALEERHAELVRSQQSFAGGYAEVQSQAEQCQSQLVDKQRHITELNEEVRKLKEQVRSELSEAHDRAKTEIHRAALELAEQRGKQSCLEERCADMARSQKSSHDGYLEVQSQVKELTRRVESASSELDQTRSLLRTEQERVQRAEATAQRAETLAQQLRMSLAHTEEELRRSGENVSRRDHEDAQRTQEQLRRSFEQLHQTSELLSEKNDLIRQRDASLRRRDEYVRQLDDSMRQLEERLRHFEFERDRFSDEARQAQAAAADAKRQQADSLSQDTKREVAALRHETAEATARAAATQARAGVMEARLASVESECRMEKTVAERAEFRAEQRADEKVHQKTEKLRRRYEERVGSMCRRLADREAYEHRLKSMIQSEVDVLHQCNRELDCHGHRLQQFETEALQDIVAHRMRGLADKVERRVLRSIRDGGSAGVFTERDKR